MANQKNITFPPIYSSVLDQDLAMDQWITGESQGNITLDNFALGNITFGGTSASINTSTIGITGTGTGYNWANGTTGIDWSIGSNIQPNSGKVSIMGPNADIEVNGRSLMNAIDALEQRLNILVPNPELEKEWDELRELGNRYRELEKQCKEKGEMWAKLKEIKK